MQLVISALVGIAAGIVDHGLVLRWISLNRTRHREPLAGINAIYSLRYVINGLTLLFVALATHDGPAIVACTLGIAITTHATALMHFWQTRGTLQ